MDEVVNIAAIGALEEAEVRNAAPPRIFHERNNPFETLSEQKFVRTYRLTKQLVEELIQNIEPFFPVPSRASALDTTTKVLTALNFMGYGSYQYNIGQNIHSAISQSSVSRAITEISDVLNRPEIMNRYICFPQNFQELEKVRNEFYERKQFPCVIGCIDCTHVAIYPPPGNDPLYPEHIYVNRKGYYSINTQLICDAKLKIINISARFPGSTHDSYIWRNSNVLPLMEDLHQQGHRSFLLLGDSGYPLRSYLLTPFENVLPETPEERYNNRHKSTRSLIEQCNGVLKMRFRCLLKHRVLHYSPERAAKIINACAVPHNICIDNNLPHVPPEPEDINVDYGMFDQNEVQRNGNGNEALHRGVFISKIWPKFENVKYGKPHSNRSYLTPEDLI